MDSAELTRQLAEQIADNGKRMEVRFLEHLERLELRPGDRFVLTTEGMVSQETAERIQQAWHKFVGGDDKQFPLIILGDGLKLAVISTGVDDVE